MRIVTSRDLIRTVHKRFFEQYLRYPEGYFKFDHLEIIKDLAGIDPETASADEVARITGAKGWVTEHCDECGVECNEWLRIGSEPDYDARWQDICKSCAKSASEAFERRAKE